MAINPMILAMLIQQAPQLKNMLTELMGGRATYPAIDDAVSRGYDTKLLSDTILKERPGEIPELEFDTADSINEGAYHLDDMLNKYLGNEQNPFPSQRLGIVNPNKFLKNMNDEASMLEETGGAFNGLPELYDIYKDQGMPAQASGMVFARPEFSDAKALDPITTPLKRKTNKDLDLLYQQMVEGNLPMDERIIDAVNDGAEFLPDIVKYQ